MAFRRNKKIETVVLDAPVADTTDYGLTFEQDKYLKRQLFTEVIRKETAVIRENPSIDTVRSTRYINFLYDKFIHEFPLLNKQGPEFWDNVNQLLNKIHNMRLSNSSERGKRTKTDKFWNRIEKIAIIAFRNIVRTPVSGQGPELLNPTLKHSTVSKTGSPADREQEQRVEEFIVYLDGFLTDLVEAGGGGLLFDTIGRVEKFDALPENYRNLAEFGSVICAHGLYAKWHVVSTGPQSLSIARRLHQLVPFGTMGTLMKYTNPLSMMRSILDLFLYKPLGTRSLAQRMVGTILSQKEGEEAEPEDPEHPTLTKKELVKKINDKSIVEKIHSYVNRDTLLLPPRSSQVAESIDQRVIEVLVSTESQPVIPEEQAKKLSDETLHDIYQLLLIETRLRDYDQISEFLGDDKVISTIKEILSIFLTPVMAIYQQADTSLLFNIISRTLKGLLDTASEVEADLKKDKEDDEGDAAEKAMRRKFLQKAHIEKYHQAILDGFKDFYDFLHKMVLADKNSTGLLKDIVNWLVGQVIFFKKNSAPFEINLRQLIDTNINDAAEKTRLMDELNQLTEYYHQQQELRREKIIKILKVEDPNKNQSSLMTQFIDEEDIDDVNYSDTIEEIEEDPEMKPDAALIPRKMIKQPEVVVIPKLVPSFEAMVTDRLLTSENK